MTLRRTALVLLAVTLPAALVGGLLWWAPGAEHQPPAAHLAQPAPPAPPAPSTTTVAAPAPVATTTVTVAPPDGLSAGAAEGSAPQPAASGSASLPGCPPPPRPPTTGPPPGAWKPPVLVAESDLPEPLAVEAVRPAGQPRSDLAAIRGKGMWIWKYRQSEGGDAQAIVDRARAAGLSHLWVRVGDSRDGFYGADVLSDLVPRAHAAGLAVMGWGFPYLHDPVSDAAWSATAMAWTGPGGRGLDGFSPDLERATEGVVMTARRARVYLGLLRQAMGPKLLVGTVYRPTDRLWTSDYPYTAIAAYVDALAPMVYWGCTEPTAAAAQALDRLRQLAPVHMIGQGYDMASEGGRTGAPSAQETSRFLSVARDGDALGASFWVWQSMGSQQWGALSGFRWTGGGGSG